MCNITSNRLNFHLFVTASKIPSTLDSRYQEGYRRKNAGLKIRMRGGLMMKHNKDKPG
jgi:hypothetical protein